MLSGHLVGALAFFATQIQDSRQLGSRLGLISIELGTRASGSAAIVTRVDRCGQPPAPSRLIWLRPPHVIRRPPAQPPSSLPATSRARSRPACEYPPAP